LFPFNVERWSLYAPATGDDVEVIMAPALSEFQVTSATPKAGKTTHHGNGHGNARKPKVAKKS
jgi:hypothetical protein